MGYIAENRHIRADQVVRLCATSKRGAYPTRYRRIVLWVEDKQEEIVFFTNHLEWGATTVASSRPGGSQVTRCRPADTPAGSSQGSRRDSAASSASRRRR